MGGQKPEARNKETGFTLIELSIVLVIIGLIVGGILVGQDLIKAAEIRAQIQDIDKLNAAVNAFRLKYNCLPGDCVNATSFFNSNTQPQQVTNGNGDGRITGYGAYAPSDETPCQDCAWVNVNGNPPLKPEWFNVFDHLAAAGMWNIAQYDETDASSNQPNIGFPQNKISSAGNDTYNLITYIQGGIVLGFETNAGYIHAGHKIRLGECKGTSGFLYPTFACGLNPDEAVRLDGKIDDGKPYTGKVYITSKTYIYRIPGWGGNTYGDQTTNCGDYATNTYKISSGTKRSCAMDIDTGF